MNVRGKQMEPDYKNWVPKGMVIGVVAGAVIAGILWILFGIAGIGVNGAARLILGILFDAAFVVLCVYSVLCVSWYCAFSYNGTRQMSRQIMEGNGLFMSPKEAKWLALGGSSLLVGKK